MKTVYDINNVNQDDSKDFLALLDKMLHDAYLKGYNHGLTGKPIHKHYFGLDESTGEFENCMICGVEWPA